MLTHLFALPTDYTVTLGNGGASAFWAVATTSLIRRRSAHACFGEFGSKFANEVARAPFLQAPHLHEAPAGSLAQVEFHDDVDAYAWPHHETSTGVVSPVSRPRGNGNGNGSDEDALVLIDATSIAGGIEVDVSQCDAYYFAPQKCFAADGGLWVAFLSPAACARAEELAQGAGDPAAARWMPDILNLRAAIANSRRDQTLNTPALATLILLHEQLRWMLEIGGLPTCAQRSRNASDLIYQWAQARPFATPFVTEPQWRSPVVTTIDFEGVDASRVAQVLRANGVVDVEPYRGLGRNQLRIATFPSVDTEDVTSVLACIDWVVDALGCTLP